MATNAWVFTGGIYSGVTKEVGNAYDKCRYKNTKTASQIPFIGIVNWYTTTDYKQLKQNRDESANEKPLDDSTFEKKAKDRVRLYRTRQPSDKEKPETYPLDHNHTHFLMLQDEFKENDDRDQKPEYRHVFRINLILDLRAEIENESRKITNQGQTYSIPIVQILVNGGASSILTVYASVNRNTPVIVIQVPKSFRLHIFINHIISRVF
ncbi:unnamed protein product [Rotaria sordida]|uniref:TRPM SLOG domain-containing protein n=1 Tax=Rotaria sordida TaxID=392033 RepID=A0A815W5S7_9BILA|nr:unnamed protein product [Rotaria sordida]